MRESKTEPNKSVHTPQKPHSEADCKINKRPHCHPSVGCSHGGTEDYPGMNGKPANPWANVGPGFEE